MTHGIRRLVALAFSLTLGLGAPLAAAQDDQPNTWTEPADQSGAQAAEPANPAPEPNAQGDAVVDSDPRALTDFRAELDPYGRWVQDPTYGTVWVPDRRVVGTDFAPYVTSGHWSLTTDGDWIWVSDYPFGWAVFHYGRWVWVPQTGWAWIPGLRYAPAWVVWRVPDDGYTYVGWAPAPPSYVWVNGSAVSIWFGVPTPYVFCHSHYVFFPGVHHYIVRDHYHVQRIASHTRRYAPARASRTAWRPGPSPTRAGVPAAAVPRQRVPAAPRAAAAPTRQTASSSGFASPRRVQRFSGAGVSGAPAPVMSARPVTPTVGTRAAGPVSGPTASPALRSAGPSPALRSVGSSPALRPVGPAMQPAPVMQARPSMPLQARPSAPSRTSAPASRPSAPARLSAPAARSTLPQRSFSSPSFRASPPPARSFSAPSQRFTPMPSRSFSPASRGSMRRAR